MQKYSKAVKTDRMSGCKVRIQEHVLGSLDFVARGHFPGLQLLSFHEALRKLANNWTLQLTLDAVRFGG